MYENSYLLYITLQADSSLKLQASGGKSFHFALLSEDFDCVAGVMCSCLWHKQGLKGAGRLLIVLWEWMNLELCAFLTDPKAPLSTVQVVSEHLQRSMVFVHHLCHASFLLDYLVFISVSFGGCWSQTNMEKLCMLLLHVHNTPLRRIHLSSGERLNENWCDEPHVFYKGYTKKPLMKLWEVDSWVLIISWMLWLASHRAL